MKSTHPFKALCFMGALCLSSAGGLNAQEAQDPTQPDQEKTRAEEKSAQATPADVNRASQVIGMEVRNQDQERLGTIKEIVINLKTGQVAYAVLSVKEGGLLSKTEKLIAVPLNAFQAASDQPYLSLHVDKEKFSQAKGFDPNHWPSAERPSWGAEPFWKTAPPVDQPDEP